MRKPFCGADGPSSFSINDLEYAVAWSSVMLQAGFALDIDGYTGATGELVNVLGRDGRSVLSVFHDTSSIVAVRKKGVASAMAICHKSLGAALRAFRRPRGAQRASVAATLVHLAQRQQQFGRQAEPTRAPCRVLDTGSRPGCGHLSAKSSFER